MAGRIEAPGLKELIQQFEEQLKVVKKNREELVGYIDDLNKVRKESKNLGIDNYQKVVQEFTNLNNKSANSFDNLVRQQKKLFNSEKALIDAKSDLNKSILENRRQTSELNKEAKLQLQINSAQEGSLERLKKVNIQLRRERDKVNITTAEGRKELERLNNLIDVNTQKIKENTDSQTKQTLNVGNYGEAVERLFPLFGKLQSSLGQIADSNESLAGGIPTLQSLKSGFAGLTRSALAFVATPVGAFIAALSAIGLVTKEFFDYNNEIKESLKLTEQLTGLGGNELNKFRAEVDALSGTFDKEFNETLNASNTLVKTFGIENTKSLDLIQDGFIRGADASGDFLDSIREYSIQFKNAGFSAEEFIKITTEGSQSGTFSDKLIDSLKELDLRLKEQTKSSREALNNAFGEEFTNGLFTNIQNGSLTTKDALLEISNETEKIGINAQAAQQLTADLFGGAGEDAGGFFKIIELTNNALSEENKELTTLQKLTKESAQAQRELAVAKDAALNSESALVFQEQLSRIWTEIQITFFNGIASLRRGFDAFKNGFNALLEPFRQLINRIPVLKRLFDDTGSSIGSFVSRLPFGALNDFGKLLERIGAIFSGVGAGIKQIITSVKNLGSAFSRFDISSPIESLKNVFGALGGEVKNVTGAIKNGYVDALKQSEEQSKKEQNAIIQKEKTLKNQRNELIKSIIQLDKKAKITELNSRTTTELKARLEELRKQKQKNIKEQIKLNEEKQKQLEIDRQLLSEFFLNKQIENNKRIVDNENLTFAERIVSNERLLQKQLELLEFKTRNELKGIKEGSDAAKLIQEKANAEREEIILQSEQRVTAITSTEVEKRKEAITNGVKEANDKVIEEEKRLIQEQFNLLQEGLINVEEFENRKKDIKNRIANEILEEQIAFLEEEIRNIQNKVDSGLISEEVGSEAIKAINAGLLETKKALNEEETKDFIDNLKKREEQQERYNQILLGSFQQLGSQLGISGGTIEAIFDGIQNGFDNAGEAAVAFAQLGAEAFQSFTNASNQSLEARIGDIERFRDAQLENENLTEEQRVLINEQADQKIAAIKNKQAQNQRKADIATSIVRTAQAVVSALGSFPFSPLNLKLAALVGGIGAAQTALIASQPLPQFYKGTENAPQGYAWTDEKGAELHLDRFGNIKDFGSDKGARLKYLDKGDKIITAQNTSKILEDLQLNNLLSSVGIGSSLPSIENKITVQNNGLTKKDVYQAMSKAISKQPRMHITMNGVRINPSRNKFK